MLRQQELRRSSRCRASSSPPSSCRWLVREQSIDGLEAISRQKIARCEAVEESFSVPVKNIAATALKKFCCGKVASANGSSPTKRAITKVIPGPTLHIIALVITRVLGKGIMKLPADSGAPTNLRTNRRMLRSLNSRTVLSAKWPNFAWPSGTLHQAPARQKRQRQVPSLPVARPR